MRRACLTHMASRVPAERSGEDPLESAADRACAFAKRQIISEAYADGAPAA